MYTLLEYTKHNNIFNIDIEHIKSIIVIKLIIKYVLYINLT